LNYFKVWGCAACYKIYNPQWTKLGPRGLKSVFVGYAQNSEAYKLLDLEANVINLYMLNLSTINSQVIQMCKNQI
jgi:hypothetical protein